MNRLILLGVACASALTVLAGLVAQSPRSSPTKEFMRQKLQHSQRVLEGITLEDFELVAKEARKLSALSQDASWRAFNNPEYIQHTETFRRHVDALARAAANRNVEGATLAYFNVTMSCVECHKFIRGQKAARLETITPRGHVQL
jgi:hypothetical protein